VQALVVHLRREILQEFLHLLSTLLNHLQLEGVVLCHALSVAVLQWGHLGQGGNRYRGTSLIRK